MDVSMKINLSLMYSSLIKFHFDPPVKNNSNEISLDVLYAVTEHV